jgi:hypothetical protein
VFDVEALAQLVRREVKAAIREELAAQSTPGQVAEYVTLAEATALTGYKRGTLAEWLREGKLTRYGRKRGLRLNRRELLGFVASLANEPNPSDEDATDFARRALGRG